MNDTRLSCAGSPCNMSLSNTKQPNTLSPCCTAMCKAVWSCKRKSRLNQTNTDAKCVKCLLVIFTLKIN